MTTMINTHSLHDALPIYDPETGEYTEPIIEKTELPCHLSGLSIERSKELFGELDTNVIVARLQQPYGDDFDYVIIDDKKYNVTRRSKYRRDAYYLEEA